MERAFGVSNSTLMHLLNSEVSYSCTHPSILTSLFSVTLVPTTLIRQSSPIGTHHSETYLGRTKTGTHHNVSFII